MTTKRIEYFDSLKFILIVLVVFGHVIEDDLYRSEFRRTIYTFIYCFHMPLFVMISGYFSKSVYDFDKLVKYIFRFFLSYLLFQIILNIPNFIDSMEVPLLDLVFKPYGPMWYLTGLIFWRIFIFVIQKLKVPMLVVIPLSFLLSFAAFSVDSPSILPYVIRIFSFFPFYVIGYYAKDSLIETVKKKKVWPALLILIFVFVTIYLWGDLKIRFYLLFNYPFADYASDDRYLGYLYQMIAYPLTLFVSMLVFIVCANLPSKLEHFFAQYGSRTYAIYLLHTVFVYSIFQSSKMMLDIIDRYLLRDILVTVLIVVICLFLDRFKVVRYIVDPYLLIENIKNKTKNKI